LNVDAEFAAEVEAMLCDDFAHAHEVTAAEYEKAPYLRRLAMQVARLFDPVL
jgi:cardiolipin synthase